jgi:hypothetical protein
MLNNSVWALASMCKVVPMHHRGVVMKLLLLLIKRYDLYKVLACSTAFLQLSLFCATFFQLRMFMLFISSKTSSSQRVFGLPLGLLDTGFHLLNLLHIIILGHAFNMA